MSIKSWLSLIIVGVAVLILWNSVYIVTEMERVVLLRFGKLIEKDVHPGLNFKWPIADKVKKFDARIQTLDSTPQFFITKDKKRVSVDSFVQWKIDNVSVYYKSTSGDEMATQNLLAPRIDQGLRNKFGKSDLNDVIFSQREEIMETLTKEINVIAEKDLGVNIIDIRIKKIELPESTYQSVYARMREERRKEASRYRADGKKEAERIRSDADLIARETIAKSYNEAQQIRGEGDAFAAATYAKAYSLDQSFFSFYRSITAYKETFSSKNDVIILEPTSDFFKFLNKPTE